METKLRYVLSICTLFLSFSVFSQSTYWENKGLNSLKASKYLEDVNLNKAKVFTLNTQGFSDACKAIESEASKGSEVLMYFPDDQGNMLSFKVKETPVMASGISAKYPQIKSYTGVSVDDSDLVIKFSVSHKGIQSTMQHKLHKGMTFIQKADDSNSYLVYNKASKSSEDAFVCKTVDEVKQAVAFGSKSFTAKATDDQTLRTYRLAVSTTGEYTDYHGGTVEDALAAINATMTRVNFVLETELAIRLELIDNNEDVIYTDETTDPYNENENLNAQVQETLTDVIGEANYDIGHLFHKVANNAGNNGNAGCIGCICVDNQKGSAFTSHAAPEGDTFDINYVIHELGHQLGANHTFSFQIEGTGVNSEPGSGSTIMAYAGITGANNVQTDSDPYFHYHSLDQIADVVSVTSCDVETALTNNPPVITPGSDYTIPKSTAFVLTGNATDADGDAITYCWEQIDSGLMTNETFGPNNTVGPSFRSLLPTTSPERYFPKLSEIVTGNLTQTNPTSGSAWETVSDVAREFNFALTVRDNNIDGGQTVFDFVTITVDGDSGPFYVISQSESTTWGAGTTETISWEVAGTDVAPINVESVDIMLSTDGGENFDTVLAENVENDGEHKLVVPGGINTSNARIMVKASDNIFFAVNSGDIAIQESEVVLNFSDLEYEVCQTDTSSLVISFDYETYLGFSETSTFSATNLPTNLSASFSPTSADTNGTAVELTFSNIDNVAIGNYTIDIMSTSASVTKTVSVDLDIYNDTLDSVDLVYPADGATDVFFNDTLTWGVLDDAQSYIVEVSTTDTFNTVLYSDEVNNNFYQLQSSLMDPLTIYYWRVKPKNICAEGAFDQVFSFTTTGVNCKSKQSTDVPVSITSVNPVTVEASVEFMENFQITDINVTVDITHTYLADLTLFLEAPTGERLQLISGACQDANDMSVTFDDDAEEFVCANNPALSGSIRPESPLSSLYGSSSKGIWTLVVEDGFQQDGGSVNEFSLEICAAGTFGLDSDNYTIQIDSESCIGNNDGAITISASQELNYEANITGNGVNISETFTDTVTIPNLSAGEYDICIVGSDRDNTFEEYCFVAQISEPESLSVVAGLNASNLTLNLSEGEVYFIEINDQLYQTTNSVYSVDLEEGLHVVKVYTDKSCQGSYESKFLVVGDPIVYPNPFDSVLNVLFSQDEKVTISLFTIEGELIKTTDYNAYYESELPLDWSDLQTGVYVMKIIGETIDVTYKVSKK